MLDAQLSPKRVGRALERKGLDVLALASDRELEGMSDPQVLEFATEERRILVTCNARHFVPIARTWAQAGREHAGLILIWTPPTDAFKELADGIDRTATRHTQQEWQGLSEVL